MDKVNKKIMWILSALSYAGILISYPGLPEKIPLHWNSRFEIDNWGSKSHILLLGLLPFLILITADSLTRYNKNKVVNPKHVKVYRILKYAVVLFLILLNWVTVITAQGYGIGIRIIFPVLLGSFFIISGNYMPALKSNYFIGIRNPWTLSNELVWRKTHKAGGYLFIFMGLIMISLSFIKTVNYGKLIFLLIIIAILGINLYSYLIFRKRIKE